MADTSTEPCDACKARLLPELHAMRAAGIERTRIMLTGPRVGARLTREQRKTSTAVWWDVGYGDEMRTWRANGLHLACARAYVNGLCDASP